MSNTPINTLNLDITNKLNKKKENKEEIWTGSRGSANNSINKCKIFKNTFFYNNNTDNFEGNRSSINIYKIKKSKFGMGKDDKNEKQEKNSISKCLSSKKLLIIFKKSEKWKNAKKENNNNESFKKIEIESQIQKKTRFDNFGNIINKKNKKIVHIVFKDQINEKPIIEEIQIESFKKFNFIERLTDNDTYNSNQEPFHKCCTIY